MTLLPTRQASEDGTLDALIEGFHREGCALLRGALTSEEVAALRARTDEVALHPDRFPKKHVSFAGTAFVLRYAHEIDEIFHRLIDHAAIRGLARSVLGEDAAFNAMNVIRNEPGQAISTWHVDDVLEFPLPESIPRFDPRIRMPVLWLTVQVALSDIDDEMHGPTQYVPGSHASGRMPNDPVAPAFEGRGPVSVFCRAGDAYLTNHQCWHRGAPNTSDRTRYVLQVQYARGWADRRFRGVA